MGGSFSYVLMSNDAPGGGQAMRQTLTTTFSSAVENLTFDLYDIDDGHPNWGDDIIVTAFNGVTAVGVTLTPWTAGRHTVVRRYSGKYWRRRSIVVDFAEISWFSSMMSSPRS